jgi:hypothetical protein
LQKSCINSPKVLQPFPIVLRWAQARATYVNVNK